MHYFLNEIYVIFIHEYSSLFLQGFKSAEAFSYIIQTEENPIMRKYIGYVKFKVICSVIMI